MRVSKRNRGSKQRRKRKRRGGKGKGWGGIKIATSVEHLGAAISMATSSTITRCMWTDYVTLFHQL